jgi:hypothetical protein
MTKERYNEMRRFGGGSHPPGLSQADESMALEEPHNAGKNRRILKEPCSFEFANYFRLVFNNHAVHGPSVARARVINAHTLTRSER